MNPLTVIANLLITVAKETHSRRRCRVVLLLAMGIVGGFAAPGAAQLVTPPAPSSVLPSDPGADDPVSTRSSPNRATDPTASQSALYPMSSAQIISILNQQPEALVEVKSLLADRLSRAGTPVQEEDISDDMLYSNLGSNSDLRNSVGTFLRARGYVSELDPDSTPGVALPQNLR